MNQRHALKMIRSIVAADEQGEAMQSLTERIHDAAAELGIDITDPLHDPSHADKLRILDRAIESCPA